jgi:phospholipid/cholesterol/gamma-HCH transport system substrate-binding protein
MKRSQLKEMSMEIIVGAFMFMILLALGFFTIILSYENLFQRQDPLTVKFEYVQGLRQGDNVFLRGVLVGRVKTLTVEPDGVQVLASLQQPVNLREGYRIEIMPSSVLGGQYVSIYEGPLDAPALPADTPLVGERPRDLMGETTEVIQTVRKSLDEGAIMANLEEIMAHIEVISRRLRDGEGTVGKLLVDDGLATSLTEIADRVNRGEGLVGKLLSDDDTLYNDLVATASGLRVVVERMEKGEGALGRLMADDELYEEAKQLLHEIRAAVDDFRETAPITTFTSIFFGAF